MIKCIVIDDEPLAREGMQMLIEQVASLKLEGSFSSVLEADEFLHHNPADLLFLDVHMPRLNGMDYLKIRNSGPLVILTTAFPQHALEAFEFDVVDYLMKPVRFERFYKSVLKAEEILKHRSGSALALAGDTRKKNTDHFFVRSDRKYVKLKYDEVKHIEGLKDYCTIYCTRQKLVVAMNLKTIEDQLPSDMFIRISKSHIVNIGHITSIETDFVNIEGEQLPLSANYKELFMQKIVNANFFSRQKNKGDL